MVIPGLFGSDLYLQPLNNWLCWSGYKPIQSNLDFNAGCLQRLSAQIIDQIEAQLDDDSSSFALIGHSRGGSMAWSIASHFQDRVSHLVMLGSPIASMMASVETGKPVAVPVGRAGRSLMRMSSAIRHILDPDCDYPTCGCPFVSDIKRPLSSRTSILSIYGRDDSLVPKEARVTEGEILEVSASHVGLVYNPEVYRALAKFLSNDQDAGQGAGYRSGAGGDTGL